MPIEWRGANPEIETPAFTTLRERLEELSAQVRSLVPAAKLAPPDKLVEELRSSGMAERTLRAGSKAPGFELPDQNNRPVGSVDLLSKGRLVICFYRGRWCPYCVAELEAWRDAWPQVQQTGASLVAISPQTVKQSSLEADQHELRFPILSDAGNSVARQFGVVYRLPEYMQEHYRSIFVNLPFTNGDKTWELPLPATYVIDRDATVLFARAHADFRQRTEPAEVLALLRKLS